MTKFFQYQNQAVRHLAYCCFGPSLVKTLPSGADINDCHLLLTPQRQQWLQTLDSDPSALLAKLSTIKTSRLGIYFESLWQFFIDSDPTLELICANQAIRENGKTLGEFDLVYKSKAVDQYYHLELAVKFYLGLANANTSRQDRWWGPNCRDRLDLKLKRLYEHQSPLSATPQGIKALASLGCPPCKREIAVKGMLFYPHDSDKLPSGIDGGHQRGKWFRLERFRQSIKQSPYWKMLSRQDWLSPYQQTGDEELVTLDRLLAQLDCYFSINERPVMICCAQEINGIFVEQQRYFITANNWPDRQE